MLITPGFLTFGNLQDGFGFAPDSSSGPDVFLRLLDVDQDPESAHDPSSVWQVELDNALQAGGRAIQWTDAVRLKNLLTGRYLSRIGRLVEERNESTLLSLLDVLHADEAPKANAIGYNSLMYVTSAREGLWLHVQNGNEDDETVGLFFGAKQCLICLA